MGRVAAGDHGALAEDLVGETFLRVYRARAEERAQPESRRRACETAGLLPLIVNRVAYYRTQGGILDLAVTRGPVIASNPH